MRTWTGRLALVLFAVALPLSVLEVALHTFGPVLSGYYESPGYFQSHRVYGSFHIPNAVSLVRSPEYATRVSINSQGLREREVAYAKPSSVRRVVVLGDSFVEAKQVPMEATMTRRLEALLNAAGYGTVEVINAGVSGWGTGQEYLLLRHELLRLKPDIVVTVFYGLNDVADNGLRNAEAAKKPLFQVTPEGDLRQAPFKPVSPTTGPSPLQLGRNLLIFDVLQQDIYHVLRASADQQHEALQWRTMIRTFNEQPAGNWERAWRVSERLLQAMRDSSTAAGASLLLVYNPSSQEVQQDDWDDLVGRYRPPGQRLNPEYPSRRMADIAVRQGFAYLDLGPVFRQAAEGERLYFAQDRHWTAAGNELTAEAVANALAEGPVVARGAQD